MVNDNDIILIQTLTDSYRIQLERYCGLRDLVRQIMGRLVLSRGVLSQLTDGLRKKQELLEAIEIERNRIAVYVERWQLCKATVVRNDAVDQFNELLQKVSDTIQEFLKDETQLQKYLEGIISRTTKS